MRQFFFPLSVVISMAFATPILAQETDSKNLTVEQRAAQGDVSAFVEMGDRYRMGQGVPVDLDMAIKWYSAGASRDDVNANFFLGYVFMTPWRRG